MPNTNENTSEFARNMVGQAMDTLFPPKPKTPMHDSIIALMVLTYRDAEWRMNDAAPQASDNAYRFGELLESGSFGIAQQWAYTASRQAGRIGMKYAQAQYDAIYEVLRHHLYAIPSD